MEYECLVRISLIVGGVPCDLRILEQDYSHNDYITILHHLEIGALISDNLQNRSPDIARKRREVSSSPAERRAVGGGSNRSPELIKKSNQPESLSVSGKRSELGYSVGEDRLNESLCMVTIFRNEPLWISFHFGLVSTLFRY